MQIFIKGNYLNNFTRLKIEKLERSKIVVVNVHGSYGTSGEENSKSEFLGKEILKKNIGSMVYFSSSRNWNIYDRSNDALRKKAFEFKTFSEEVKDLEDTLDLIISSSKDLFNSEKIKIYIVAESLGGKIISAIAGKYEQVEKIILSGAGIAPTSLTDPILSTYPPIEFIKNTTSLYKGKLMSLQGSKDEVVSLDSQDELFEAYTNASFKSKKIIEGANHSFSSINGENKQLAYQYYVDQVVEFLQLDP